MDQFPFLNADENFDLRGNRRWKDYVFRSRLEILDDR
jgi:hypothetical protein